MRLKPTHPYQYAILLFAIVAIFSSWSTYKEMRSTLTEPIHLTAADIRGNRNVSVITNGSELSFEFEEQYRGFAEFVIDLPEGGVRSGKIDIVFGNSKPVWWNRMYFRTSFSDNKNGKPYLSTLNMRSNKWLPIRTDNLSYSIPLYRDITKGHIVVQIKHTKDLKSLPIESISIQPLTFFDTPAGALIICLLVGLGTFLPGFVMIGLTGTKPIIPISITAFLFSTVINIISLILTLAFDSYYIFIPAQVLSVICISFIWKKIKKSNTNLNILTDQRTKEDLNIWLFSLILISVLLSFQYPDAVHNMHQGHTTEHTFNAFTAHDSVFQFYNAKAILENDFDKYYADGKLIFQPQDREILPGLSYAAIIQFLKNFISNDLALKYFAYNAYFLFCHALILNIIFSWFRSTDKKLAYLLVFFISTTPVFWTLSMLGWFKITGAALILAGIYVVKQKPESLSNWIIAGLLFGLSKNYHGGNALLLPIITLWIMYLSYKTYHFSLSKLSFYFVSLTSAACLLIFPWNVFVKNFWHTSTHKLFSSFFLGGHYNQDSLLQSIQSLFTATPFSEQLSVRLERTATLFDTDWFWQNLSQYIFYSEKGAVYGWLTFSTSYFTSAIILYFVFALMLLCLSKFKFIKQSESTTLDPWVKQLGWICLLNVLVITFCSYGPVEKYPAISWELPTLVFIGVLSHCVIICFQHNQNLLKYWKTLIVCQTLLIFLFG